MKQVGGLTGAGPLLHRAILAVAQRHAPGQLRTPAQEGAVPLRVCSLSGLRAVPDCPALVEWFMPGTEPVATCDWHRNGRVALPAEYADWAEPNGLVAPPSVARFAATGSLRIVSPMEGDVYRIPPGVEPRYATIRFQSEGGEAVRWLVNGRSTDGERWVPHLGRHEIRAISAAGDTATARIEVR